MTDPLSIVELEGVLVATLVILVKRLAQNLDQRLVLRGGGSHSHKGEQNNLEIGQTSAPSPTTLIFIQTNYPYYKGTNVI